MCFSCKKLSRSHIIKTFQAHSGVKWMWFHLTSSKQWLSFGIICWYLQHSLGTASAWSRWMTQLLPFQCHPTYTSLINYYSNVFESVRLKKTCAREFNEFYWRFASNMPFQNLEFIMKSVFLVCKLSFY